MIDERKTPCATCPYRRSVRLAFWSIREYQNLLKQDCDTLLGKSFGCHADAKRKPENRRACTGWLLDQRRRGTPSVQLRIKLFKDPAFARFYDKLKDLGSKLYGSIQEMYEANYPNGHTRPMQPKKRA